LSGSRCLCLKSQMVNGKFVLILIDSQQEEEVATGTGRIPTYPSADCLLKVEAKPSDTVTTEQRAIQRNARREQEDL